MSKVRRFAGTLRLAKEDQDVCGYTIRKGWHISVSALFLAYQHECSSVREQEPLAVCICFVSLYRDWRLNH